MVSQTSPAAPGSCVPFRRPGPAGWRGSSQPPVRAIETAAALRASSSAVLRALGMGCRSGPPAALRASKKLTPCVFMTNEKTSPPRRRKTLVDLQRSVNREGRRFLAVKRAQAHGNGRSCSCAGAPLRTTVLGCAPSTDLLGKVHETPCEYYPARAPAGKRR